MDCLHQTHSRLISKSSSQASRASLHALSGLLSLRNLCLYDSAPAGCVKVCTAHRGTPWCLTVRLGKKLNFGSARTSKVDEFCGGTSKVPAHARVLQNPSNASFNIHACQASLSAGKTAISWLVPQYIQAAWPQYRLASWLCRAQQSCCLKSCKCGCLVCSRLIGKGFRCVEQTGFKLWGLIA